ncbi:MAG TPA: L-rhamnose isomerase [Feifaniaceae bacterium]|nr:L-rhamnose isomerase [Feifaniaceae bacterium]
MGEGSILRGYEYAKEIYAAKGVDVDAAIRRADGIPVSMHCWQGDDVIGFDSIGELTGGIATTGNYPGRASTPQELRADMEEALKMVPGRFKLNLHASYAEKNGKTVDRDAYTIELFQTWVDWAKERGLGLDFNPTFYSHPMMDGNFSLASPNGEKRKFWVEHGKRCREIAHSFAKQLGQPCSVNYWMPDGMKDTCADTAYYRAIMTRSLDEIFAGHFERDMVLCALESKLFGIGVESYTVASHEYSLAYALKNDLLYTLDAGHFHPAESISEKISPILGFLDKILLHVSRGVRWDSDHVIALNDELQRIMDEVLFNGFENRVLIGLDFFDASINRIAAWTIGLRNARKAILNAALAPSGRIRRAEREGDYTLRLALQEERKSLPFGAVWDYYCLRQGKYAGEDWIAEMKRYEKDVLAKR